MRDYHVWTPEEVDILRENYPERGGMWPGWADVLPNRTKQSICQHAHVLGLGTVVRAHGRSWSDDETWLLERFWPGHGYLWDGWDYVLPERSRQSIRDKASYDGLDSVRRRDVVDDRPKMTQRQRRACSAFLDRLSGILGATVPETVDMLCQCASETSRSES